MPLTKQKKLCLLGRLHMFELKKETTHTHIPSVPLVQDNHISLVPLTLKKTTDHFCLVR